jgi:hypothetical protein
MKVFTSGSLTEVFEVKVKKAPAEKCIKSNFINITLHQTVSEQ